MEVLADQHCSFLGNVTVGKDVSLHRMQELYHAVMSGSLHCIDARLWLACGTHFIVATDMRDAPLAYVLLHEDLYRHPLWL